jgi:hypothetical protein
MLCRIRRAARWHWSRMWDRLPDWLVFVWVAECLPESWFDQAD